MKKVIFLLYFIFVYIHSQSQTTAIPDPNFEQALISMGFDSGPLDGFVNTERMQNVINLDISNRNISDLTGIQEFSNLSILKCNSNLLTSLDFSNNPKLFILECMDNKLETLIISNNNLRTLYCGYNNLKFLDLSNSLFLEDLYCVNNQLTELILDYNDSLKYLGCSNNKISELNLINKKRLKDLLCNYNNLNKLDLTNTISLENLYCDNNSITDIILVNSSNIKYFNCSYNNLISLDLSNLTLLSHFYCYVNKIEELNLSNNILLNTLECRANNLTTLDISKNILLGGLDCNNNNISFLDVTQNTQLKYLNCRALKITTLNLSNNTLLTDLECENNGLTELDLSNNILLGRLWCRFNKLSTLILTNNINLIQVDCSQNLLTELDLLNNTLLQSLYCNNNFLKSLDFSKQKVLSYLNCAYNNLTQLNLNNGNTIGIVGMHSKNNPNLNCIVVDDPWLIVNKWINKFGYSYEIDSWSQITSKPCGENVISGNVYYDKNNDCIKNNAEIGLSKYIIKASNGNEYYSISDNIGNYKFQVNPNTVYELKIVSSLDSINVINYCSESFINVASGVIGSANINNNIGVHLKENVLPSVEISKSGMRRCFRNSTTITYKNEGTVDQLNAQIFVDFPEYVSFISANKNYSVVNQKEGIYKFDIPNIPAFSEGKIYLVDSVACGNEDIRGYTQCIKTWITPKSNSSETKDTSAWDNSSISVDKTAQCLGDSLVRFIIRNNGSGDMKTLQEYRFFYNNEIAYSNTFKLNSGDSLVIDATADGSTIRLEADQNSPHPGKSRPRTTIEGCGSLMPSQAKLGFWPHSPLDDLDFDIAEVCLEIRDSYDPNEKTVTPSGVTEHNYVPEKEPLHYTIQFQNTGSDVAYNIIVVDTLSQFLDISTLRINSSSHNYTYKVQGENNPVLVFTFKDINLLDSTANEKESHGFISFTIEPIKNIIPGSHITNSADIYFDYNSAIRTNTTSLIALDTIIESDKLIIVKLLNDPSNIFTFEKSQMHIYPNPCNEFIILDNKNKDVNQIQICDVTGSLVITKSISEIQEKIDVRKLNSGIYFITILNDIGEKQQYKMIKK